jgi:hypothetical protein
LNEQREKRLAAALRANLKRRKAPRSGAAAELDVPFGADDENDPGDGNDRLPAAGQKQQLKDSR